MEIKVSNKALENLNEQTEERTAERIVYNSADILKLIVHQDVELNDNVNFIRATGYNRKIISNITYAKDAEIKLAIAHVIISVCTLIKQMDINQFDLEELIEKCIKENKGRW